MKSSRLRHEDDASLSELINQIIADKSFSLRGDWVNALIRNPDTITNYVFVYSARPGNPVDRALTLCSYAVFTRNVELLECLYNIAALTPAVKSAFESVVSTSINDPCMRNGARETNEPELQSFLADHARADDLIRIVNNIIEFDNETLLRRLDNLLKENPALIFNRFTFKNYNQTIRLNLCRYAVHTLNPELLTTLYEYLKTDKQREKFRIEACDEYHYQAFFKIDNYVSIIFMYVLQSRKNEKISLSQRDINEISNLRDMIPYELRAGRTYLESTDPQYLAKQFEYEDNTMREQYSQKMRAMLALINKLTNNEKISDKPCSPYNDAPARPVQSDANDNNAPSKEQQLLAMCNPATKRFIEELKTKPKSFATQFADLNVTDEEIERLYLAPDEYTNPVTYDLIHIPVLVQNQVFDWHDIVNNFKLSGDNHDKTITPYAPYESLKIKMSQLLPDTRAVRDMVRMLKAVNDSRAAAMKVLIQSLHIDEVGRRLHAAIIAKPIDEAFIKGCIDVLGQEIATMKLGDGGFPFLNQMIAFAPLELINKVLVQLKDHVNDTSIGWSLLHHACSARREPEVIHALLQAGCTHINARGPGGSTPLIWAARERLDQVIKALLEGGADPSLTNSEGHDAMYYVTQEMTVRVPTHEASATLLANSRGLSIQMVSIFTQNQTQGQSTSSAPACNK